MSCAEFGMVARGWTRAQKSCADRHRDATELLGWVTWRPVVKLWRHMPSRQNSSRALASHPGVFFRSLRGVTASEGSLQSLWLNSATIHTIHPQLIQALRTCLGYNSCRAVTGGWTLTQTPCLAAFHSALKTICVPPVRQAIPFCSVRFLWALWGATNSWPSCVWRPLECPVSFGR